MTAAADRAPSLISHDMLFHGERIGSSWLQHTRSEDGTRQWSCLTWMKDVAAIGLKGYRKRSLYVIGPHGVIKSATIWDSNGGHVSLSLGEAGFTFNAQFVPVDYPIDLVIEPNQMSLLAVQLAHQRITDARTFHAVITDNGGVMPVTYEACPSGLVSRAVHG